MQQALREAEAAMQKDEVPVGVVIVHNGQIIAKAHNQVEMLKDPTAHAEMIAITQAASALSRNWLYDCTMYVTVEPCSMCAGAIVLARIKKICFGTPDPKTGACGSVLDIAGHPLLNHRVEVMGGFMAEPCSQLMSAFFKHHRNAQKMPGGH